MYYFSISLFCSVLRFGHWTATSSLNRVGKKSVIICRCLSVYSESQATSTVAAERLQWRALIFSSFDRKKVERLQFWSYYVNSKCPQNVRNYLFRLLTVNFYVHALFRSFIDICTSPLLSVRQLMTMMMTLKL